ncbi:E3 ubiquitin-protein ligase NEURL3 isoform X2 [Oreochromis niloticus]|uniref:E3 ubiquitin-protein ligase NEURL3 isoform X2 n=1 Tax=Oreochromis niloticus TaxID=8128 RepID=UPI0003944A1C|nr:E3 ubiquitin-protein ligase NEURL3 isoform X2 [Oreochromis niloticus]
MRSITYLFKMVKQINNKNSVLQSEVSHRCSLLCLGPLAFHHQAVGEKIRLSHGGRLAEKTEATFKNGLVFSSRPVKVQERIRLRVQRDSFIWDGALRVGFTTVPPSARSLPLPCMAIPNLTDKPGHWAVPLNESVCEAGSELEFWVSDGGSIYVAVNNRQCKELTGVDLSQPLWAMIDIYGQTSSILLLGSEKHTTCVVCKVKEARITLPCGHRCLCKHCNSRVCQEFGTCPLCRHKIRAPSAEELV